MPFCKETITLRDSLHNTIDDLLREYGHNLSLGGTDEQIRMYYRLTQLLDQIPEHVPEVDYKGEPVTVDTYRRVCP